MATFHAARAASTALRLERIGAAVLRYGLALIVVWIGALKFAAYEAAAIEGLVANSPLLSWMYGIGGVPTVAAAIGVGEIVLGVLIAVRPLAPRVSAVGQSRGDPDVSHHVELHAQHPGGVAARLRVPVPVGGRAVPGQGPDPARRGDMDGR